MVTPATGLQTLQHQAVISSMHRSYQPLKPATNRYLQQRWDQNDYENHRKKVGMKVEECRARVEVEVQMALVSFHNISLRNSLEPPKRLRSRTRVCLRRRTYAGVSLAAFTCPGELLPASGGQQRPEDAGSHPAEAEKAAGQQIPTSCLT